MDTISTRTRTPADLLMPVIDALGDVMLLLRGSTDGGFEIVSASARARHLLAPSGSSIPGALRDPVADAAVAEHVAAAAGGRPVPSADLRLRSGTVLEAHAVAVPDDPHVVWVARDVTAERRATAELERSNLDLQQFAYVASHDLSEPLRMVSSFVELLSRRYAGKLDERADEYIGFALEGARRMRALIDDLLEVAALRSTPPEMVETDLADVVETVLADLRETAAEAGAELIVGPLPSVDGDPRQLRQLLQNLIANALKFRRGDRARVEVAAEPVDGGEWRISVEDDGIGIPPQHRTRVFDMFSRLHGRSAYPGSGIGLALCHRIVLAHGGSIWIDEGRVGGTRVTFTLRALPPEPHDRGAE